MKSLSMASLLILATLHSAIPQYETGTIIVFRVTPSEAIIAADSRQSFVGGAERSRSVCKILTFDGKYVFAASGYSGRRSGRMPWDLYEYTNRIYREGHVMNVRDFADKWAKQMQELLIQDSKISAPPLHGGNTILTAVFIGVEGGVIDARARTFHREKMGFPSLESLKVDDDGRDTPIGEGKIVAEFLSNKTARAAAWHKRIDPLPVGERPYALVKLVEDYGSSSGVGGEITSLEINASSGIRWRTGKARCGK